MNPTKKCEFCGKTFNKKETTSKKMWTIVRFCSKACHYASKKGKKPTQLIKANTGRTGEKSHFWNGGRICRHGYIAVHINNLNEDDRAKYKSMFQKWHFGRYCYEHRLIVAQSIGRPLKPTEQVHHINADKRDNRQENLYLFVSNSDHRSYEGLKNKYKLKSNIT